MTSLENSDDIISKEELNNIERTVLNEDSVQEHIVKKVDSIESSTDSSDSSNTSSKDKRKKTDIVIHHHHHHHHHHHSSSQTNGSISSTHTSSNNNNNNNNSGSSSPSLGKSNKGLLLSAPPSPCFSPALNKNTQNSVIMTNNDLTYVSLKKLSLQNLNALQHFALAMCRDISFVLPILGFIQSIQKAWSLNVNTLHQSQPQLHCSGTNNCAEDGYLDFFKILFYIQQQDTKALVMTFQNFWSSHQNTSKMLINPIKYFYNNDMDSSSSTLLSSASNILSSISINVNASSSSALPLPAHNLTEQLGNAFKNKMSHNTTTSGAASSPLIRQSYLSSIIRARSSEYLLCALWCFVSMYLTYVTLDALMVRWITRYSVSAAILRMFSISLLLIIIELFLISTLTNDDGQGNDFILHTWIFISCILTVVYIWQSFWTSFLQQQRNSVKKYSANATSLQFWKYTLKKHLDLYNIIVFAVVPIGVASFITMIILLRNLVIQRMDVGQLEKIWFEINNNM